MQGCVEDQPGVQLVVVVFSTDVLISGGLCVLRHPSKVDHHTALIADNPGVVTGRHIECITGAVLDLGTVVHLHDHAPFKDVAGVRRLA